MASGSVSASRLVVENSVSNKSVPSGTGTTIAQITIPEDGVWMIVASVNFPANATGNRQLGISQNQSANWMNRYSRTIAYGNGTYQCRMLTTTFDTLSAGTTLYARAYQDSGTSLTASDCGIRAVKIA